MRYERRTVRKGMRYGRTDSMSFNSCWAKPCWWPPVNNLISKSAMNIHSYVYEVDSNPLPFVLLSRFQSQQVQMFRLYKHRACRGIVLKHNHNCKIQYTNIVKLCNLHVYSCKHCSPYSRQKKVGTALTSIHLQQTRYTKEGVGSISQR